MQAIFEIFDRMAEKNAFEAKRFLLLSVSKNICLC
jgi:hypothetical protein